VRCWRFDAAARREEEEYPSWIFDRRATPLQRQKSATLRAKLWRPAGSVVPQSQSALAMLLRRALPATHQSLAHLFPIYEMGSRKGSVGASRRGRVRLRLRESLKELHPYMGRKSALTRQTAEAEIGRTASL